MTTLDEKTAKLTVFTYKEGLLSSVAHDLAIDVTRFTVERDDRGVHLAVDADSLRTRAAREDGRDAPKLLSAADRQKIDRTIATEVLSSSTFPRITAASTATGLGATEATVTIKGRTARVPITVVERGDDVVASARLSQPDFGIKPYTALLGALKLKPELDVVLEVPRSFVG